MDTLRKTSVFVLAPIFAVMLAAAVWYHLHGSARAEQAANYRLESTADLIARLIGRRIGEVQQALDSVIAQGRLQQHHMYSQVDLLDEAEDARLWIEHALERLAEVNPHVQRIECYSMSGERFVAVVEGRRVLTPHTAADEAWFAAATTDGVYRGFDETGRIRLAGVRHSDHSETPIAVVSIVFNFHGVAEEAAQFATRRFEDVHVAIFDTAQTLRFEFRGAQTGAVLRRESELEELASSVRIQQSRSAALAEFYSARNALFGALAMVTIGLLAVAALGTRQVVNELRGRNDSLAESRAILRTLIDESVNLKGLMTVEGTLIDVNRTALSAAGVDEQDVLDLPFWETPWWRHSPELQTRLKQAIQQVAAGGTDQFEAVHPSPDGDSITVEFSLKPVKDGAGRVIYLVPEGRDVTAHKRLEQQLDDSREAAESANRAKSEFLANMSHEIRTPLNAVIGLTEIVMRSELDETQRDYLGTVVDSADSLLTIINDILDFSKIEAGKLELENVRFNLHDVVGDTLKSLAFRAQHKNLELACFIDPSLPSILTGDPMRLRQVVANLVGNAIKFTPQGEVVVRVEPEPAERALASSSSVAVGGPEENPTRTRLFFSVRDTGVGVAAEKLDRLFEAFEQADMSTARRYGGTGLGLSICTLLVELMGGRIGVESVQGQGSTFHFTADFAIAPEAEQRLRKETQLEGLRVLIVDDNPTNRKILEEVTRAKQMLPLLTDSTAAAIAQMRRSADAGEPIQLVLSDVNMPVADGFALAAMIREDRRFDDVEIVFLTSGGHTGDLQRCETLRVAARLMKPVKQSELFEVISRTMGLEEPPADGRVGLEAPSLPHAPPQNILLVEDSIVNQKVALAILKGQGHTVTIANDGREGLDRLAEQDFDVVLMDVQMPEMDGFAATAAIREQEAGSDRHQPIIAMTAHSLEGDREKCLAAGMDDYVSKPVRREQLFHALARAASRQTDGSH